MAYDRYDRDDNRSRPRDDGGFRGRDEGRERQYGGDRGGQGGEDRGFFERARDEVTSWFGDEEAERRRMQDDRMGHPDSDRHGRDEGYGNRDRHNERGGSGAYGGGQGSTYGAGSHREPGARGGEYGRGRESGVFGRGESGRGEPDRGEFGRSEPGRGDIGRDRSSIPYPGTMNQSIHEPRGGRSDFGGDRGRERSDFDRDQSRNPRAGGGGYRDEDRGSRSGLGGQDFAHAQYGRQEFSQDQGSDRPGAGYNYGGWGDRDSQRQSYGASGNAGSGGDTHYHQLRQRHIEDLDRDYDEFRREHQSKFESEFSGWRQQRQTKRQMLDSLRENMEVVGSDGQRIGTVDKVRGDNIILNRKDPEAGGVHRSFGCTLLDRIEGDRVFLSHPADQVRQQLKTEDQGERGGGGGGWGRALFGGGRSSEAEGRSARLEEGQGEGDGPHILDKSFPGTYEDKDKKDQ